MLTQILNQALASTDASPAVGSWVELGDRNEVGMELVTLGSLTGSWLLEASSKPLATLPDASPSDVTAGFTTIAGAAVAVVSAASSQAVQANVPVLQGRVRATFVKTGGSGTAIAYVRN